MEWKFSLEYAFYPLLRLFLLTLFDLLESANKMHAIG